MSVTFLITLIAALLAIAYWRVVLMIVFALILAVLVTGISAVSGAVAGQEERTTIIAPAEPEPEPDGSTADRGGTVIDPQGDPRAQEQPPR